MSQEKLQVWIKHRYFCCVFECLGLFVGPIIVVETFASDRSISEHTACTTWKAASTVTQHQSEGSQLSPFIHINQFADESSIVFMYEVNPVWAYLHERDDSRTSHEVLLVAE